MKLLLVGHGKMGKAIDELAAAKGIEVVDRRTRNRPLRGDQPIGGSRADLVVVDFSVPEAVPETVQAAARLSLNVVIGTTGWQDRRDDVKDIVEDAGISVVHASNFSIGVNVLYRLAEQAAEMLSVVDGYDPFILDWHHRFKKDSPSGTALEIQSRMERYYAGRRVPITSQRAGYVPSVHAVGFDSEADTIHLEHRARNRRGLAEGALLAAGWVPGHSGFHDFRSVLDDLFHPAAAAGAARR